MCLLDVWLIYFSDVFSAFLKQRTVSSSYRDLALFVSVVVYSTQCLCVFFSLSSFSLSSPKVLLSFLG